MTVLTLTIKTSVESMGSVLFSRKKPLNVQANLTFEVMKDLLIPVRTNNKRVVYTD